MKVCSLLHTVLGMDDLIQGGFLTKRKRARSGDPNENEGELQLRNLCKIKQDPDSAWSAGKILVIAFSHWGLFLSSATFTRLVI